ncbi:hypothetical protein SpAn4DRAFT_1618 [Sporomusa ovata]|uniref:Uncharacterized protein n=1 Tax=Sporomusa ovata TaxID=2378 RepID=A0A0U1KU78_9FIRM|nr:hypothetical protein [Sporomusa ovata]CQR70649.1 hypothetical protein SpAn4DRAFT_1618 [Sporomusa ovata]
MQDNTNSKKGQAEALSAALDELNQGITLENMHEEELVELMRTAQLIKAAVTPPAVPPPAVRNYIVEQAAISIARAKRKKRLAWGVAGFAGTAAAAVLLITFFNILPPATQEQQLAKSPQSVPVPAIETPQPSSIEETPPNLTVPPAKDKLQASTTPDSQITESALPESDAVQAPGAALTVPSSAVPSGEGTMLALAGRKADVVTIDTISKTIRQVYHQGAPDEIIISQAPKPTNTLRSVPVPPQVQEKMAIPREAITSKFPNRNKVTVIMDNNEVTLEGAASQEELLSLAKTLTKVSVPR